MHKDTENKFDAGGLPGACLRLGQVDFINCLPINFPFELGEIRVNAQIVNGIPSEINERILSGEIDIAPASSVTYLENKDKLIPIGDLCIASNGPSDSVLLFSKFPVEELGSAKIALSNASATSNKLLQILLNDFLKLNCKFTNQEQDCSAYLLIGDHALLEYSKKQRDVFIYDLGSLWKKHTGLPMIFGIWVARKEIYDTFPVETQHAASLLRGAKEIGLGRMFDKVIKKAQSTVLISKDFYNTYFQHLSYDFTDDCKRGLSVFEECCKKVRVSFAMK